MKVDEDLQDVRFMRRRKRRKPLRTRWRRVLLVGAWILFFAAWSFAVWRVTVYLGKKESLGKEYYQIDPGFHKTR
jgi:hypothetical protein